MPSDGPVEGLAEREDPTVTADEPVAAIGPLAVPTMRAPNVTSAREPRNAADPKANTPPWCRPLSSPNRCRCSDLEVLHSPQVQKRPAGEPPIGRGCGQQPMYRPGVASSVDGDLLSQPSLILRRTPIREGRFGAP